MAVFSNTYEMAEIHGTRNESADWNTPAPITVQLKGSWVNRYKIFGDFLGDAVGLPNAWPYNLDGSPASPVLLANDIRPIATHISAVPFPEAYTTVGQACEYDQALYTVTYDQSYLTGNGSGTMDPTNREIYAESMEPHVEFQLLDPIKFHWTSDEQALKDGEAPGRQEHGLQYNRTLFNVKPPLSSTLISLHGNVNSTAMTLMGLAFGPETLLYKLNPVQQTVSTAGVGLVNISISLLYNSGGWNKFWRADAKIYDSISYRAKVGGAAVAYDNYTASDLTALPSFA